VASTAATSIPELRDSGICRGCGERFGWVTLRPGARRRPVDPEPKRLAEYALLLDGVTVVNLRDERVDERFESHTGPRFWDHAKTCAAPSMMTARVAVEQCLGLVDSAHRAPKSPEDRYREEQRQRLRGAGRPPWVTRRYEPPAR
jgi:hypothetical protein